MLLQLLDTAEQVLRVLLQLVGGLLLCHDDQAYEEE